MPILHNAVSENKRVAKRISPFITLLCLCLILFLPACTQIDLAAVNLPTEFDNTKIIHDVAYGSLPQQTLDIYIPQDAAEKPRDVVVFFYGGRWTTGAKEDYRFVGSALAAKDFIVVIPDYRKYPQVRFPTFVQDGAKSLAWVYDTIASYGGNPARIHVAGHSAGAHIGALLTADAAYLKAEGQDRSQVIHDFAGLAGPYAFTPDEPDLEDMFGPPSQYPQMQVPTFIDGRQPPMLLLYGDADTEVKPVNIQKLQARIRKKGGCVETILYPHVDHIDIIAALSWINPADAPVLDDMTEFFRDPAAGTDKNAQPPLQCFHRNAAR